jgi:hypothetical protein
LGPSLTVFASENDYPDIEENKEIVLRHLNAPSNYLQDFEDSFLFAQSNNNGISLMALTGSTFYAPNGGTWTYTHGGPTSTAYNYQIKYRKVEYLTRQNLADMLASQYDANFFKTLSSLAASGGISAVKNYITSKATSAAAAAFIKYLNAATTIYGIVTAVAELEEAAIYGPFQEAYNSGYGMMVEYYQYTYNGYWYNAQANTKWTRYPYAPMPSTANGYGNIVAY